MARSPLLFVLFLLMLFCFNGTQLALAQSPPVYTDLDFELAAEEGQSFTYEFPPYLFVDADSDPMTYALRDNNSALVSWLTFNPATKTLSGTPGATELGVGVYQLIITATDDEGPPNSTDSRIIYLTILPVGDNDAPQENTPVPSQDADAGDPYSYSIPQNIITDVDGQSFTLKYELTLDDGNPIPAWLTFEPWRRQLSGTPALVDVGTLSLRFAAFDQNGAGNYSYFQLTVHNPNAQEITAVASIPDINVPFGTAFGSITFPSMVAVTLAGPPGTTNLAVTFSPGSYNPNVAGTHTITGILTLTVDVLNSGNHVASVNVIVAKGNQTITFAPDPLPAKTVADITTTFSLTSTASSGLPVSYTSADPLVASISGPTVTINGGGSTLITASQSGSSNYNPATPVSRTLTVTRLSQTITFGSLSPVSFSPTGSLNLTATASSGLPITYSSSDINVATISGSTLEFEHAGTVTITALQAGNTMYDPATPVDQILVINKGNQVITFAPLPPKDFPTSPFFVTASVDTGLPLTFESSNTGVATIGPAFNEVAIQNIGTTIITARQAGNADYNASFVDQTLIVGGQTITFGPLPNKPVNDPDFALTASASSGLAVSYASSNPAVATILLGSTVHIVGVGTTTITASQPGNTNFLPATPVDQPFTVTKASQTISFSALAGKETADPPFNLTATATSGLTVTFTSSNPAVATVSGSTVTIVGAGTTNIMANQAGDASYDPAPTVTQPLAVNGLSQTITFGPLANKLSNDPPFALSATATSGLTVSFVSSNPGVATVSGNTVTITGIGTTNIIASQAGNATYNAAANVPQPFTVISGAQDQTITFPTIPDQTLGDTPYTLNAIASSGLPVAYSTTSDKVSLSGNQAVLFKSGRVNITANQPGNASFNPAPAVIRSFCIKPGKPFISGAQLNTPSPVLTSTASSGNQWFLNDVAIAGATGVTINVQQAGVYSVQATTDDCVSTKSDNFPVIFTGDLLDPTTALKIYPNPVGEDLYVSWPETTGTSLLRIYQLDGKEIERLTTSEHELSIPVGHYADGQYVLSIQTTKTHFKGRFLKK